MPSIASGCGMPGADEPERQCARQAFEDIATVVAMIRSRYEFSAFLAADQSLLCSDVIILRCQYL
jgi:hypothetical protein